MPSRILVEDKAMLGLFLPLVKKGMDDFPPYWVEFQIRNAVKILLAAKRKQGSGRELRGREMLPL